MVFPLIHSILKNIMSWGFTPLRVLNSICIKWNYGCVTDFYHFNLLSELNKKKKKGGKCFFHIKRHGRAIGARACVCVPGAEFIRNLNCRGLHQMTAHPANPPPCCFLTLVGAFAFSIALGSDSLRRTFHICREKETFICALVGNLN